MSDLENQDRPREKLKQRGARSLSDRELIALLIGTGTRTHGVLDIASALEQRLAPAEWPEGIPALAGIPGLGESGAARILAALELGRRRSSSRSMRISSPADAFSLVRHLAGRKQEHLVCLSLNGASELIASRIVCIGLVDRAHVHPREVFADPITDRASGILIAHNHPSGCLTPSDSDIESTSKLEQAGKILGIELIDHIIFSTRGYFSFQERGMRASTG